MVPQCGHSSRMRSASQILCYPSIIANRKGTTMKKRLIRCLILVLMLTLVLSALPSCGGYNTESIGLMQMDEESRAYALYENMANSLLTAIAFSVKNVTTYSGKLDGQILKLTHTVDMISKSQHGAARMDYYEDHDLTQYGEDYRETRLVSGYADGYLFKSNYVSGYTVNAKTAVPYNEFDYMTLSEQLLLYPDQWGCETVTCERNKDGSFTATFAGLSRDGLNELSYDYGLDLSMMGESIYLTDATVVMHSTPDLRFQNASFSLTYTQYAAEGYLAEQKFIVKTEQTFEYAIPESFKSVDLSAYDDIGDLTVLDDFMTCFDDRIYAERGSYTYASRENIEENGKPSVWLYNVNMNLDTYQGALFYSSEGSYGYEGELTRTRVNYENGIMEYRETDHRGEKVGDSYEYTEGDMRYHIRTELNLRNFSPVYVTRIEEVDAKAGKYRFHLGASLQAEFVSYFYEQNGSLKYMDAYMDVTLGDGKLKDLSLYVIAEGYTDTAKDHMYELKVTCTFSERNTSVAPV